MTYDSKGEDEFASADHSEAKESGATHNFGIVQITEVGACGQVRNMVS